MSLARSGVKKSPVTMRSHRPPCSPGICASNWMLTQLISSPSRLAISLPSSIRIPWRLPFSSMYWTGGRVALVATTSLPGRTTAGGVTAGEVGYFAACAWAGAGAARAVRARRHNTKRRPGLPIRLPPVGLGACVSLDPAGWSTTAVAGQKASSIYHESVASALPRRASADSRARIGSGLVAERLEHRAGARRLFEQPARAIGRRGLVEHGLELPACLRDTPRIAVEEGELDPDPGQVRIARPCPFEVLLGLGRVAAHERRQVADQAAGHEVAFDVVWIEAQHGVHLLADGLERNERAQQPLHLRPAPQVDGVPEVRVRAVRRVGDGPLGGGAATLVGGEPRVLGPRAILREEKPGARQGDQLRRVGGSRARKGRLQEIARLVDASRVILVVPQQGARRV